MVQIDLDLRPVPVDMPAGGIDADSDNYRGARGERDARPNEAAQLPPAILGALSEMLRARFGRALPEGREAEVWNALSDNQRAILEALVVHQGKANAVHLPALRIQAGIRSDRQLQDELKTMVEDFGLMIARGVRVGVFIIETPEELDEVVANMESRGISNLVCASRLRRTGRAELHALLDEALGKLELFPHSAGCGDAERPHAPAMEEKNE